MVVRLALAVALAALVLGGPARADESCGTCHPDVRTDYEQGIHAKHFSCTACHGGDPTVTTMESHDKTKGYIGKPSRKDIPALCASCHADPRKMKPFGLPTDQYAQYKTSEHGIQLAKGNTDVAVCTDCHGVHRILPPEEPTSPVARLNIPSTCGHCHSNKALMAKYHLRTDQVEKFRESVHGKALFVEDHPDAPTCATCHGAHGAVVVAAGNIANVCGNCHERTREYFSESPHRAATESGAMSECASCHGYHDINLPTSALFDTACRKCHPVDSAQFKTGQELKTLLNRADEAVSAANREMTQVALTFPTVVEYRPRLQQGRAYLMEALTVQHSLAVARTQDLTRSARSISEDVESSVYGVSQGRQLRYVALAMLWTFLLFTAAIAYLYKRQLRRRRAERAGDISEPLV